MRIEWKMTKKRGNLRPMLTYSVQLEDHEKNLALPCVSITSTIPKPLEDWQEHCYPGQYERSGEPLHAGYYTVEAPSHKGHAELRALRLPWRDNNEYPEVEASFTALRDALEEELLAAGRSQPINLQSSLQTSAQTRVGLAPAVLAERLIRLTAR